MSIPIFIKLLLTTKLQRIAIAFAGYFGLMWLFIEPAGLFLPQWFNWGWTGYAWLVVASLVLAVVTNLPRVSISRSLHSPDCTIEIKVGDLFDQTENLVIGLNDVFDTEPGEIIKTTSVQGQFLSRIYGGERARLDADIEAALKPMKEQCRADLGKQRGKQFRYPIGTTIVLGIEGRRYFLCAYGHMRNDLSVKSSVDDIWRSLSSLWQQVRLRGHGRSISIPIIGSELARTNLPRMFLAKLIILSFLAASKEAFVAERMTLVVYSQDLDKVDLSLLEEFLESTRF